MPSPTLPALALVLAAGGGQLFTLHASSDPSSQGGAQLLRAQDAADGAPLWSTSDFGPEEQSQGAQRVAATADGAVVFVAVRDSVPSSQPFGLGYTGILTVRALDGATGALLWSTSVPSADDVLVDAERLTVTPDGVQVAVSATETTFVGWSFRCLVFDGRTGAFRWSASSGLGSGQEYGRDVAIDPVGGRVFALATSSWVFQNDAVVVAYDLATGATDWSELYAGLDVGGVHVQLNVDAYTLLMLEQPNSAVHANTLGALDADAKAQAAVNLPAGLNPALAGATIHHAFVTFGATLELAFASSASPLLLAP